MSTEKNGTDPYVAQLSQLIDLVNRLEEGLEALDETMSENHRETLEAIRELQDSGSGFSTFES